VVSRRACGQRPLVLLLRTPGADGGSSSAPPRSPSSSRRLRIVYGRTSITVTARGHRRHVGVPEAAGRLGRHPPGRRARGPRRPRVRGHDAPRAGPLHEPHRPAPRLFELLLERVAGRDSPDVTTRGGERRRGEREEERGREARAGAGGGRGLRSGRPPRSRPRRAAGPGVLEEEQRVAERDLVAGPDGAGAAVTLTRSRERRSSSRGPPGSRRGRGAEPEMDAGGERVGTRSDAPARGPP